MLSFDMILRCVKAKQNNLACLLTKCKQCGSNMLLSDFLRHLKLEKLWDWYWQHVTA